MSGEIADMMLDGTLCEGCGDFLGEGGYGFARYCRSCEDAKTVQSMAADKPAKPRAKKIKKIPCTTCGRWVGKTGMADHVKDKHGASS
jgi:hypothetical protein